MRLGLTLLLTILIASSSYSQSMYGYLGKRFFVSGAFVASPSIFSRNLEGDMLALKFNLIGTLSANLVMNKKHAMAVNYKRYSSVASVQSEGEGLVYRAVLGGEGRDIGDYRFTTNEIGWNYQFFGDDLDAPLGSYVSVGLGIAFSKYNVPFQTFNTTDYDQTPVILSYDNTKSIKSPIIRFGFGKQTVFWNNFLFDYGVDVGFNLAFVATQFRGLDPLGTSSGSSYGGTINQEELDFASKKAVQNRVFMMNLINFKMGLSYLIF